MGSNNPFIWQMSYMDAPSLTPPPPLHSHTDVHLGPGKIMAKTGDKMVAAVVVVVMASAQSPGRLFAFPSEPLGLEYGPGTFRITILFIRAGVIA